MSKTIARSKLKAAMQNSQGQFFAVKFIKKNGDERMLAGKIAYTGKGGKDTTAHIESIVKVHEHGFMPKNVDTNRVIELRINKEVYKVAEG